MKISRLALACSLCAALILSLPEKSHAEGFALMEASARGMALGGGLVARGGDPSVLFYNPAAMTTLKGTQMQANLAISQFYWGVDTRQNGTTTNSHSAHQTWPLPSFYVSHQFNDRLWFGVGTFTRFGLGVKYPHNWPGGYNLQKVTLLTGSLNPNVAYKITDNLSVAVGVELMYASMQMRKNLTVANPMLGDCNLNGHGGGIGGNVALHWQINDQWAAGISYRSPISLKIHGKTRYDCQIGKIFPYSLTSLRILQNSKLRGTLHLPDSIAMGVSWKPMEKLSLETNATYTVWSRFRDFNMYMKDPVNEWNNTARHWKNSWTFAISAEYEALDWLTLRAGFMYETSPQNYGNSDYMVPSNGRNYYTLGAGFHYGNWTIDVAYMYIRNRSLDYTQAAYSHPTYGILPGRTTHPHAHNFGLGITYKF